MLDGLRTHRLLCLMIAQATTTQTVPMPKRTHVPASPPPPPKPPTPKRKGGRRGK